MLRFLKLHFVELGSVDVTNRKRLRCKDGVYICKLIFRIQYSISIGYFAANQEYTAALSSYMMIQQNVSVRCLGSRFKVGISRGLNVT
jgi:hypothetical protein